MKKIIIHWTGGTNQPCNTDYEHYHFLINGDGVVVKGKYIPEDNENCYDGKYAAHTGGGNTGTIGIAMCGMYVPRNKSIKETQYPLTKKQCEATFKLVAEQAKKYKIPLDSYHIMTHYEFGKKFPNTSSAGKIDIIYLPPYPTITQANVGEFIRTKIKWYYNKLYTS